MTDYKHILIAVDFSQSCTQVLKRALSVASQNQASIDLIHVVEYYPLTDFGYEVLSTNILLEEEIINLANKNLTQLISQHSIPYNNTSVIVGSPKTEIIRYANEQKIDLIIIGSHGRHGIQRLLGSTAYPVMHNAKCDVLAIRIND